jgi:anti-sigma regulatory factor (Ser/Thr protein kinase)
MHTAIPLSPVLGSAARARRLVEWFAEELEVDPTSALIVATELTTNAVRHGEEPIVMRLRLEDGPWFIEVSDWGAARVPTRSRDTLVDQVEGGMGLLLIARLSLDWGVRHSPRGYKTVWAALDVEPVAGELPVDAASVASGVVSL